MICKYFGKIIKHMMIFSSFVCTFYAFVITFSPYSMRSCFIFPTFLKGEDINIRHVRNITLTIYDVIIKTSTLRPGVGKNICHSSGSFWVSSFICQKVQISLYWEYEQTSSC